MKALTFAVNDVLKTLFLDSNILLVDYKLEFGVTTEGEVVLGDEFTPDSGFSDAVTISVTNRQGNIDVTRTQNTIGSFAVAAGASDPGTGGTYLSNVDNIDSDTIVVRGKFSESGRNNSEGPTNNVITLTDDSSGDSISINISCRVTNS